jgi:hypothetical protein
MRKVPITQRTPQPGNHLTTRTADGSAWRHGILLANGTVRQTDGQAVSYASFGSTGYMVYVVEGPGTLAEINALPVTHDPFYDMKL